MGDKLREEHFKEKRGWELNAAETKKQQEI